MTQDTMEENAKAIQRSRQLTALKRMLPDAMRDALDDPSVVELMLNPDGNLWVEQQGQPKRVIAKITPVKATDILNAAANLMDATVNFDHPMLEGVFPIGRCRLQGMVPPIVDAPAFTLRRPATRVFTIEDYVASGRMKQVEADVIRKAVRERKNILVCGPTGSGKTTLTNAIYQVIREESPDHRLVVIEDTQELQVNVPDCLMLKTAKGISMEMLLKSVLRCRPDRVGVGEVRSAELYDLLKLWNTGHPGGLCTLHCENTSEVAARLLQMCLEHPSAKNLEPARLLKWLSSAIGLVVFIAKTEHRNPPQVVSEVVEVQGFDPESETFLFKPAVTAPALNGETHVQRVA